VQIASSIDDITAVILGVRFHRGRRARLIAVSGIDGSGKGYVSARLAEKLSGKGFRVAAIAADGWLNLPHVRFGGDDPGEHFYSHAFRFEEMFSRLIEPLARDGSSHLTAEYVEETATCYRKHVYEFDDVDLILLEGIFLFKRELQQCYDFRLWIECSFKTALERPP
jgi:uridine kinase